MPSSLQQMSSNLHQIGKQCPANVRAVISRRPADVQVISVVVERLPEVGSAPHQGGGRTAPPPPCPG
eukprot:6594177-Alexandrium_andersonii.AAC.1